jgi:uncharacterized membrane protein YcjF (UPF0283 family)
MILIEIQDTLHPGMPRNKYSMAKLEGLDEQQKAAVIAKAREAAADETESGDGGEAHVVLDDRDRFEVVQMRKAVTAALYIITAFFMTIAVLGGLAYGYNSCGNILSCFENPAWLIIAANTMVLIHVLAAYQVYSQPVFYLVRVACSNSPAQYQPALPLRRQRLRFGLVTFLSRHLAELTACLPLQPAG